MTMLAFIGFGEVGRTFARQLLATNSVQVAAYECGLSVAFGQVHSSARLSGNRTRHPCIKAPGNLGQSYIIDSFLVVVFGGVGTRPAG